MYCIAAYNMYAVRAECCVNYVVLLYELCSVLLCVAVLLCRLCALWAICVFALCFACAVNTVCVVCAVCVFYVLLLSILLCCL